MTWIDYFPNLSSLDRLAANGCILVGANVATSLEGPERYRARTATYVVASVSVVSSIIFKVRFKRKGIYRSTVARDCLIPGGVLVSGVMLLSVLLGRFGSRSSVDADIMIRNLVIAGIRSCIAAIRKCIASIRS